MMDLSFVQMFWQMFDKIFARISFYLFQKDDIKISSLVPVRRFHIDGELQNSNSPTYIQMFGLSFINSYF